MDPREFPSAEAYAQAVRLRLGRRLRRLREERGLSRLMLQRMSGVTDETIRLIELGVANPSSDILSFLAFALGVPVGVFQAEALEGEAPPDPPPAQVGGGVPLPTIIG